MKLKNWLKVLTSLFSKVFRGILFYPRAILPSKNFLPRINFDDYFVNQKFLIVRRTEKKSSEAFDELGFLRLEALISGIKDVPEMSMNLLGGFFKLKHLKYIPKGKGNGSWESSKIRLWDYKASFEIKTNVYPIYFILNDIYGVEIPYVRRSNDPAIKKLYKTLSIDLNEPKINSQGLSTIEHKPINLNYWHVEFHLSDKATKQIVRRGNIKSNDDEYWQNKLTETALNDILITNAKKSIDDFRLYEIPKSIYNL